MALTPTLHLAPSDLVPEEEPERSPEPSRTNKRAGRYVLYALMLLAAITGSLSGLMLVYSVNLPQIEDLEHYRPSTTTQLYDRNGVLIGTFALEHRQVVDYNDFSPLLREAVISIEDKSFESHWGINTVRVIGSAWHDIRSKGRAQGASTLTMQLARNLFLSADRTAGRKIQEAYLAIQIERSFTKQQIFTLYGNQIYLGHGQYGFEAASEFYFSKHAKDLNLPEAAMLAGLPKGPVAFSPILNPEKCLRRRNLVISELEDDKHITHEQAEIARKAPLGLHIAEPEMSVAPWFQEEVRRELEKQFGTEQVHEAGLKVETTLDINLQKTANHAVYDGLAAYERRHGWKGNLENVLGSGMKIEEYHHADWAVKVNPGDYVHAVVTSVMPLQIHAKVGDNEILILPEDWRWTNTSYADALVKPGDLIYVHLGTAMEGKERRATLEQDSGAQGALMLMDNSTGDVLAMVGGRDYSVSQFNRATQAQRQTGSSFKPYVYTTAMESGMKPMDIVVDSPVSYGGYSPHNYEHDFRGPMSLVSAFAESRNVPAVKLAAQVGIHKVIDLAHRFGVTSNIPAVLPVALGAAEITLQEQVTSYAVFPNDGLRVQPRMVRKVQNAEGLTLWENSPAVSEVVSQQTARSMMVLLRAVTTQGTGAATSQMHHPFGGKTGTTSDYTDAWFLGFSPSVTCGVWVGFDSRQSLGERETGAKAALPIWMAVMKEAIAGKDSEHFLSDDAPLPTLAASDKAGVDTEAGDSDAPDQPPAKPTTLIAKPAVKQAAKSVVVPVKPLAGQRKPAVATTKSSATASKPAVGNTKTPAQTAKPPANTSRPVAAKTKQPVNSRPVASKAPAPKPATSKPVASKSAASKPAGSKPVAAGKPTGRNAHTG